MKMFSLVTLPFALSVGLVSAAVPEAETPPRAALRLTRAPEAGDKLVFKQGMTTEAAWIAEEMRWFEKNLIPAISRGWEGKGWRSDALHFIRERLVRLHYRAGWDPYPPFEISGEYLMSAGCNDPWVRMWTVWDRQKEGFEPETDLPAMIEALKEIQESFADIAVLRFASLPLIQVQPSYPKDGPWPKRQAEILEKYYRWTAQLGRSPCYGKEDESLLFRQIRWVPAATHGTPPALAARLEKEGTLPAWIIDGMAGEAELKLAWESRGDKLASEVTEEGWRGFEEHLGKARKHLTAAWKARPDLPYAPAAMIQVVMGGGGEEGVNKRLWFDRAIAGCFDYHDAYKRYEYAITPKWGGSRADQIAFAFACMDSGRGEPAVSQAFSRIISSVGAEMGGMEKAYVIAGVPERVRTLNETLLGAAATPRERTDRLSHIMLDSWFLGDWTRGFEAAAENSSVFSSAVDSRMSRLATTRTKIVTDLVLFGKENRPLPREADAKEKAGDFAAAARLWKASLETFGTDDWVKDAARARTRRAELIRDYQEGKWVNVPVDHAEDWDQLQGDWEGGSGKGLTGVNGSETGVWLVSYGLPLGPRFELRAKMRLTGADPSLRGHAPCLMLNTGFNPLTDFHALTASAEIAGDGIRGFLGRNSHTRPESPKVKISSKPTDTVVMFLRRSRDGLTFVIDGDPVFENSGLTAGAPDWETGLISLGGCNLSPETRLTVESVEARRLP